MKKIYNSPVMNVVKMTTRQQVLTASNPNVGIGSGTVSAGSVESREDDDWDWDD